MIALFLALTGGFSPAHAGGFTVTSTDVSAGKPVAMTHVFNGFGCTGQNVSPQLAWSGAPAGTQSFAVLVHDPDAPTGGAGWWHWLAYNLPASTTSLPQGAGAADGSKLPAGAVQAVTDFGGPGWGGPCPPPGDKPHRYNITVYALKVATLDVPAGANAAYVGFVVNANTLAKATLTPVFGR